MPFPSAEESTSPQPPPARLAAMLLGEVAGDTEADEHRREPARERVEIPARNGHASRKQRQFRARPGASALTLSAAL